MTDSLNQRLLKFIQASPTPYHATKQVAARLDAAGFQALHETDAWAIPAGRYYVKRNDSSIIAFNWDPDTLNQSGLKMVGAHTDSPCLKVKPNPVTLEKDYQQLGVEVYGGVLMNPWFDRDLSLAGKVTYRLQNGQLRNGLINFEHAIAVIPSLAIHLDRDANTQRSINAQTDLPPIISQTTEPFEALLKNEVLRTFPQSQIEAILAFDLCFYDVNPPALIGLNQAFIASARLDNLLSCFIALDALVESDLASNALIVLNDHEEVGSSSIAGADGSFLVDVLARLTANSEDKTRILARSLLISTDNAHGVHPNFSNKHDPLHSPQLNQGPVIKVNANQRYATNTDTHGYFRALCDAQDIPHQVFVTRSDMGCGSTIGPITASKLGVKTLDIGLPTFGMHSIRELAGAKDPEYLLRALTAFFNHSGGVQIGAEI
ncbi:MAG: M18 family aminopeptidase [Pseudomonadales bacterium]|jgi:aspartyl aminopeptidase|tara:strand:+ start:1471 stop:2769 length:1299 start_codon:yes stop_codon:yes gene_type:complete